MKVGLPSASLLDGLVIVAAVATVPLLVLQASGDTTTGILVADWLIWFVFAVDFSAGLWFRRTRFGQLWDATIVVVSFPLLPQALGAIRLVRLVRILRVARIMTVTWRAVPALRATVGRTGVLYVAGLTLITVIAAAGVLTTVEPEAGGFWSGIWWALVTTTTVGYGDIAPVSLAGRAIAVGLMFCGITLVAALGASITAHFVGSDSDERLERIEARLEQIEMALQSARSSGNKQQS